MPPLCWYKAFSGSEETNFMNKSLVAIAVCIGLASCGGGGGSSPTDGGGSVPTPTPSPTPTPAPTPTPPPTDHSGLAPLKADVILAEEYLSGGDATVFVANEDAFGTRPILVAQDFRLDGNFTTGDHIFRTPQRNFGPLLNTDNCQGCHLRDGRGILPESPASPITSMLVKMGNGQGKPDPIYGDQLQTFAAQSFSTPNFESGWPKYEGSLNGDHLFGEAYTYIKYEVVSGQYPDGQRYELRKPVYYFKDLSFGDFAADMRFSPRVAPQVFGAGLLEAIPDEHLRALADEQDANNDGISGKLAMVNDVVNQKISIGRFSYKAQNPSVLQQAAAAYRGDVGNTNRYFPQEPCTQQQVACIAAAEAEQGGNDEVDIADTELAFVEFYNRVLGVPARRGYDKQSQTWDQSVSSGRKLFFEAGCIGCHTPRHVTGVAPGSALGELTFTGLEPNPKPIAVLSEQVIFPYTDLLLHDMGGSCQVKRETAEGQSCSEGESCLYVQRCEGLADGLPQNNATGSEWKTAPLWGLGLVHTVNSKSRFLHDGRARTIEEAILWHGGEAETAKSNFMQFNATERRQVLAFLGSL